MDGSSGESDRLCALAGATQLLVKDAPVLDRSSLSGRERLCALASALQLLALGFRDVPVREVVRLLAGGGSALGSTGLPNEVQELGQEQEQQDEPVVGLSDALANTLIPQYLLESNCRGGTTSWRNVRYGGNARRLTVYDSPDVDRVPVGSLPFAQRLEVCEQRSGGGETWLCLEGGKFANRWVRAAADGAVDCVQMGKWIGHQGRVPTSAYRGQEFPKAMYTEGFAGSSEVCLVSASGEAFWDLLNIEMLFRDIATATVFEQAWQGDENFMEWVAYFAVNCVQYGQLRTGQQKRLLVTVRHTSRWQDFQFSKDGRAKCRGPDIQRVQADIGKAQGKECRWLRSMEEKLQLSWDAVEFVTAFAFLRKHCNWTADDCRLAANEKLSEVVQHFHELQPSECVFMLESAYWCWDEAFHGCNFQAGQRDAAYSLLLDLAAAPTRAELLGSGSCVLGDLADAREEAWARLLPAARCAWGSRKVKPQVYALGGYMICGSWSWGRTGTCGTVECSRLDGGNWNTMPNMTSRREDFAVAVMGSAIFALGGWDGENGYLDSIERFERGSSAWQNGLGPLQRPRASLGAAVVGKWLFAVGGQDGRSCLNDTEWFEPPDCTTYPMLGMPTQREQVASASVAGQLYVLGGYDGTHGTTTATVERYDPSQELWTAAANMTTPRRSFAAVSLGGALYAVGGHDGRTPVMSVERFDPVCNVWSAVTPLPAPRYALAAVTVGGAICVLGGRDKDTSGLSSVAVFDPATWGWRDSRPLNTTRRAIAAVAI